MLPPLLIFLLLCFISCFSFFMILGRLIRTNNKFASSSLPYYGPKTYPIIGCLYDYFKNRHNLLDWYTHLLQESPTQTILISRLGARRTIVTANPVNVEYILKTNFNNYPKSKPFTEILRDFLGNGIFNVDGELWSTQRKLVSHQFSAKALQDHVLNDLKEVMDEKLIPLLESLANTQQQKAVDLQDILRRMGFDIICKFSLGFDPDCLLDHHHSVSFLPVMEAFDIASKVCAKRGAEPVSAIWKFKKFLGVGSEKSLKESVEMIHSSIIDIIHEKKKYFNNNARDLLSKMIMLEEDEEAIRDMVISFIMAGKDTTSSALTWLFYILTCHPEIEDEVVKELKSLENQKLLEFETLKQLRYLMACLCECLRLYPPVAWDSKHALVDDFLPDGGKICAGDRVTYFQYGMGRMVNLWGEDRFEFRPERWIIHLDLEEEGDEHIVGPLKKISPYKFSVFQAGPRTCLGKEMAFIQMKYIVAMLLKKFKFRPVDSENSPKFVPLLTAHMHGGFWAFVERRDQFQ